MTSREIKTAIGERFAVKANAPITSVVNRAIRTLPGGPETLDAIEAANAARNHAQRAGARDRVIAIDAAIDRLEAIRNAMARHVFREAGHPAE